MLILIDTFDGFWAIWYLLFVLTYLGSFVSLASLGSLITTVLGSFTDGLLNNYVILGMLFLFFVGSNNALALFISSFLTGEGGSVCCSSINISLGSFNNSVMTTSSFEFYLIVSDFLSVESSVTNVSCDISSYSSFNVS